LLPDQAVSPTKNDADSVLRLAVRITKFDVIEMASGFITALKEENIALKEENMRLLRAAEKNPLSEGFQAMPDTTTPSVDLDSGPHHYEQQGWPTNLGGLGFDSGFVTSVSTQEVPCSHSRGDDPHSLL
jgi:hypothetical protein